MLCSRGRVGSSPTTGTENQASARAAALEKSGAFVCRGTHRAALVLRAAAPAAHPAAHGFVPGRSAVTGAARHTQAAVVISLDLTTFFAAVTAAGIYGVLRRHGYPESVAHAITG